mmetsp:Transcript_87257/g.281893  ORF Transcript_87257/g.281893 Transcript_87257/m.281893 type:complete len:268 (+) Transcript_87257:417-1220(+)
MTGMPAMTAFRTTFPMNMLTVSRGAATLALMIAGRLPLAMTQFMPCANIQPCPAACPFSLICKTLTEWRVTPLATPYCRPPMMPETCVPCPETSAAHCTSSSRQPVAFISVASIAAKARPPKSSCVVRMPLSRTYTWTPSPIPLHEYTPSSGKLRWSMRSKPQLTGWTSVPCTPPESVLFMGSKPSCSAALVELSRLAVSGIFLRTVRAPPVACRRPRRCASAALSPTAWMPRIGILCTAYINSVWSFNTRSKTASDARKPTMGKPP